MGNLLILGTGGDEKLVNDRLAPIITDSLRNEINARTLTQLVSGDRNQIVTAQLKAINEGAATLGMRITDLRLKQIDLPTDSQVITDVYERMRAQRKQVASQLRAEGEEQARTISAQADRDQAVLVAEAERDAQRLRGEGDAEAARIYAAAANKDPSFFAFQRSLESYKKSFADGLPTGSTRRRVTCRLRCIATPPLLTGFSCLHLIVQPSNRSHPNGSR
jgi:membrane protease subunit HflC